MNIQGMKGVRGVGGVTWSCKQNINGLRTHSKLCYICMYVYTHNEYVCMYIHIMNMHTYICNEYSEGRWGGASHGAGKKHQWPANAQQVVL